MSLHAREAPAAPYSYSPLLALLRSQQAVLSCTMIHGGEVHNVIPDRVTIGGTIRDLAPGVFETITARMKAIVAGQCASFGATGTVKIDSLYPCVENHPEQALNDRYVGVTTRTHVTPQRDTTRGTTVTLPSHHA